MRRIIGLFAVAGVALGMAAGCGNGDEVEVEPPAGVEERQQPVEGEPGGPPPGFFEGEDF